MRKKKERKKKSAFEKELKNSRLGFSAVLNGAHMMDSITINHNKGVSIEKKYNVDQGLNKSYYDESPQSLILRPQSL